MKDTYISEAVKYIGADDTTLDLFESQYQIPNGVSYNSYVILDEKVAVMDTIDERKTDEWFANLENVLNGRTVDYLVISHLEPDHAANIKRAADKFPQAQLVLSAKAKAMLPQFFDIAHLEERCLVVKEGDTLELGTHKLHFVMAPMVHWPEVMVEYEETEKILFSADAFGSFGSLHGHVFADEIDYKSAYTDEMRRYYTNIVGKYGTQVSAVLKKAATLEISTICPLHGFVWRKDLAYPLGLYTLWANYKPEKKGVLVCYSSIYGNTENAADVFAAKLCDGGIKNLAVYDVSKTDASYLVAEAFRYSHIAFFASTYNAGLFPKTEYLVNELISHNLKNRTFAFAESGSWAPVTANKLKEKLSALGGAKFLEVQTKINCALNGDSLLALENTANAVIADLKAEN